MSVLGIGTNFRSITLFDRTNYSQQRYIFLLHQPVVLVAGHWEHAYNILDNGDLIIWQKNSHTRSPMEIKGIIFPSSDPMVIDLNKALLEEAEANMLGLNPKE